MRSVLAVLAVVLAVSGYAQAADTPGLFQGVPWGTSLKEMKRRYPGGHSQKRGDDGQLQYGVVLEIAGRKNAIAVLGFDRANQFQRACVLFPKAGTPVDWSKPTTPEPPEEAAATWAMLLKLLQQEYGPGFAYKTGGMLWNFANGTIFLSPRSDGETAAVVYSAPNAPSISGL